MNKKVGFITFVFFAFLFFWICVNYLFPSEDLKNYFTDTYGILAGLGGILGLMSAKKWGYCKSFVGKSIIFFSLGLMGQFLGQLSYTLLFYIYGIENAYPSFGEIFFLSSIPLYIAATYYLAKASGFDYSLKSVMNKIWILILPVIIMSISYSLFLKDYDFTDMPLLTVIIDFAYPLGQALFVATAIIAYLTTKDLLGGIMKSRVRFVLFALVYQYIADSMFIYETITGIWGPAGLSDVMFLTSYYLMSIGMLWMDHTANNLSNNV